MTPREFKEGFKKATVWKEADELIAQLTVGQRECLSLALETLEEYMGLDPREQFYYGIIKAVQKYKSPS